MLSMVLEGGVEKTTRQSDTQEGRWVGGGGGVGGAVTDTEAMTKANGFGGEKKTFRRGFARNSTHSKLCRSWLKFSPDLCRAVLHRTGGSNMAQCTLSQTGSCYHHLTAYLRSMHIYTALQAEHSSAQKSWTPKRLLISPNTLVPETA